MNYRTLKLIALLAFSFFSTLVFLHFYNRPAVPLKAESAEQIATSLWKSCKGRTSSCYPSLFNKLTLQKGYDTAISTLVALQKIDKRAVGCHLIAHNIGKAAYVLDTKNWRNNFARATTLCSYGVGHGIVEAYSQTLPSGAITSESTLLYICKGQPPSCPHVFGHVLLLEYKGNIEKTLETCHVFSAGVMRNFCYNGVFMEEVFPDTLVQHGLRKSSFLDFVPRLPELITLCNSYTDKNIQVQCWGELSQPALKKNQNNAEDTFKFCEEAPVPEAQTQCINRVISSITIANGYDLKRTSNICLLRPRAPKFESSCINLMMTTALGFYPNSFIDHAVIFCKSLRTEDKAACFKQSVAAVRSKINTASRKNICDQFPTPYQADCLK